MNEANLGAPIDALVANVLETTFDHLDADTVENARMRLVDVVGCVIGGANAPGNAELIELVRRWGGREEATILVHGGRVPAHNAAMVNGVMARSFDFGPVLPVVDGRSVPGHICETTVPTALTVGEAVGADGKELITSLVVGDDVACRVLAGARYDLDQGWDCTGTVNAFGAVAIAGRLLGLNRDQMRNAFGIVLNTLGGSFQIIWDRTTSFKLPQGLSARDAIFSAELARAGWTGPKDALLSRCGYYELFTEGCTDQRILTKDLGKKFYTDSSLKPYPCCRGTHPGIDCALALADKYAIKAEDIDGVTLRMPRRRLNSFYAQPFVIGDFPHANAIFSCHYAVANALVRGSVKPEHFTEECIRDPRTRVLAEKITLAELPDVHTLSAELRVRLKDGREVAELTVAPKGDCGLNPMSYDEIKSKFLDNVRFSRTIPEQNVEGLLGLLENVEKLDSVARIVGLMVT